MGLLDFLQFKSKEQIERDRREFEMRVFPFGAAQRDAAHAVLRAVVTPKLKDTEMLFAFISAKDRYILDEKSDGSLKKTRALMLKQGWIKKTEDIDLILTLVRLDSSCSSLDEYPAAEDVLRAYSGEVYVES